MKTGISFNDFGYGLPINETMKAIRLAGFNTFFSEASCSEEKIHALKNESVKVGLEYESVHAPFGGINVIWQDGDAGDEYVKRLCNTADICSKYGIGYFTMHCMNVPRFNVDVKEPQNLSDVGVERFRRIVEYAENVGVKACLENVEFPHYELKALISTIRKYNYSSLGFTWDVGHENCYPCDMDVMGAFGDLLVGTHIHDNFGQKDPHTVTWDDDSHVPPFDGKIDYIRVANKLKAVDFKGSITLEIGRNKEHPTYKKMTIEEYLTDMHRRAALIAACCETKMI